MKILNKIPLVGLIVFCVSCTGLPLLDKKMTLTDKEKKQVKDIGLMHERPKQDYLYLSNIKNPFVPTKKELFDEAHFQNEEELLNSIELLKKYLKSDLNEKQLSNLSENCNALVGKESNFVMSEKNLACSLWWLSDKQEERKKKEKLPTAISKVQYLTVKDRKKWKSYQGLKLSDASFNFDFDNYKEAAKFIKQALRTKQNCSYKESLTALILKLETFLPDKNVFKDLENLHKGYNTCFKPNEAWTESLNLRLAMIKLISGEPKKAKQLLMKNLKEESSQESTRTLFWLGTLDRFVSTSKSVHQNPYWDTLISENQISLFSIIAAHETGKDPLDLLVPDETVPMQNRTANGWNESNLQSFLSDLFLVYKMDSELYIKYLKFVSKSVAIINKDLLLYWTLKNSQYQNHYESLLYLGRFLRQTKGYKFTPTLLKIQYPLVYLKQLVNEKTNIDPVLILSLIRQESAFNTDATSSANARGLMQLLPGTAKIFKRNLNANDLYDPDVNLKFGASYLSKLFNKYGGQTEYVLGAYNAGPMNMDRWLERTKTQNTLLFSEYIPFKETRNYISIILRNYYWYSRILSQEKDPLAQKAFSMMSLNRKQTSVDAIVKLGLKWQLSNDDKNLIKNIYLFGSTSPSVFACKSCETKTGDASNETSSRSATDISR